MIQLWSWPTPNGQEVQILLEELGVPYRANPVNILRGEQFSPDFLAFSPNNKIPAIIDEDADGKGTPAMVDSTAVRAHRWAAGAKGGSKIKPSDGRAAGTRPRSTRSATVPVASTP